uniref:p0696G06.1 protein n=1 Tax=Oryza sativa subsp. japonica TaxID=39947 RepID=Q7F453_ORYSJ|nr:P0696G06.1 [Oryza sativa Japonica Group]
MHSKLSSSNCRNEHWMSRYRFLDLSTNKDEERSEKRTRNPLRFLYTHPLVAVHPPLQRASQQGHTPQPPLAAPVRAPQNHTSGKTVGPPLFDSGPTWFCLRGRIPSPSSCMHRPCRPGPTAQRESSAPFVLDRAHGLAGRRRICTRGDLPLAGASESADSSCLAFTDVWVPLLVGTRVSLTSAWTREEVALYRKALKPWRECPFDIQLECNSFTGSKAVQDHSRYTLPSQCTNAPDPPPLPGTSYGTHRTSRNAKACRCVPEEIQDFWDRMFFEAYQYDLRVLTEDGNEIMSHSCVVGIKSPVLRAMLEEAKVQGGIRHILIPGVPSEAVHVFIRFLYSSRFEQYQMKRYVLHLLVLSHVFSVPSLKRVCINQLETSLLSPENVVDILQLARLCDAPRLSLVCTRMIIGDFKAITQTEGWRVMRQANPSLEQELLESLVEEDTKRQERARRLEENKVYLQLHEAMEALIHICRDGCRTIGPRDQTLKSSQAVCRFPACKGIELLLRHFSACKMRAFQGENATSEQKGGGQVESFGVQGVGEQSNNQFHLRKEKISIPENIVLRSRFTSYKNYALTHKLDVNCEHLLY